MINHNYFMELLRLVEVTQTTPETVTQKAPEISVSTATSNNR
jgi:hypothetical protein